MTAEHSYKVHTETIGDRLVSMHLEGMNEIEVTSAPDWWPQAPEGRFSPQTLFVSASASCLILSLYKVAERMHLTFKNANVDALGEMDEIDGIWRFSKISLKMTVVIENESDRERMSKAIEMAHGFCPIRNSLSIPSLLEYKIVTE